MSMPHQPPPTTPSPPPADCSQSKAPVPAGPSTGAQNKTWVSQEMEASRAAGGVIQVPASSPPPATTDSDLVPVEGPEKVQDGRENEQSGEPDGDEDDGKSEESETTEVIQTNIGQDSELAGYDWDEFERRYTDHMSALDLEENKDYDSFDEHATSFLIWAQSASQRDNARISKRLRTQSRFTQLAENSLEDKKRHYVDVVSAFQKALDLLRQQSPPKS
ncbi:unnamed protein product [Diplocarpon coronariae]